jgi:hypothetical protein
MVTPFIAPIAFGVGCAFTWEEKVLLINQQRSLIVPGGLLILNPVDTEHGDYQESLIMSLVRNIAMQVPNVLSEEQEGLMEHLEETHVVLGVKQLTGDLIPPSPDTEGAVQLFINYYAAPFPTHLAHPLRLRTAATPPDVEFCWLTAEELLQQKQCFRLRTDYTTMQGVLTALNSPKPGKPN